jgi:hypothetical protein
MSMVMSVERPTLPLLHFVRQHGPKSTSTGGIGDFFAPKELPEESGFHSFRRLPPG